MKRAIGLAGFALSLSGCAGDGSDIGPRLPRLPEATAKVQVLDDQGRGVAGARVVVAGTTATTGRAGRGDLLADPRGSQWVQVLTDAASATASDRLAPLWLQLDLPGGELPFVVHVPDTAPSDTLTIATGSQFLGQRFEDTQSGAALEIAAGCVVTGAPLEPVLTLRFGTLAPEHLPPGLPPPQAGAWLVGRGHYLDPPHAGFQPPQLLEVPDDLGLSSGGTATLFHLDPFTGRWQQAGSGATASGGRLQLAAAVASGGLYAFAVEVPDPALVRGRVLDGLDRQVAGAFVRVDAEATRTDGNGFFTVAGVAGTLADGTPRAATVEVRAGARWLPLGTALTTPALGPGGVADLGNVRLDSVPVGNIRALTLVRGRADPRRRLAIGTLRGNTFAVRVGDDQAQMLFEDVPAESFGITAARPLDRDNLFLLRSLGFLQVGRPWFDLNVFFNERPWYIGARSTAVQVLDAQGGGPFAEAVIVRGSTAGGGFSGRSTDGSTLFVNRPFDGRATAVAQTAVEGRTVTSAFSIERPNADQLELPVLKAMRTPAGAFDRHAMVQGTLPGHDPLAQQQVSGRRLTTPGEWLQDVFGGAPVVSSLPVKGDPAAAVGSFRVGVAVPIGHLVGVEGTTAGGVYTLHKVGIAADLQLPEATVTARDLALDLPADTVFTAVGLLGALEPSFPIADLRFDLALLRPNGLVVDVVRGVGGNHAASGQDVQFTLPALAGALAGGQWLCAVHAADSAVQHVMLRFAAAATVSTGFLPLPVLLAPANGATVPVDGFTVQFELPPGTLYATIDLSSPGTDALHWSVVLPGDLSSFPFVRLPAEAKPVLVAGRSYDLTLTAWRADEGRAVESTAPYRDLTTFWYSFDVAQRGVRAASSRQITITVN